MMWLQACTWWVGTRVCLRSGRPAVSRKNQHPQLGWETNLQLSGEHGAWGTDQTDLMPCLGSKICISSHQVVKEPHVCSAISDSSSRQSKACRKFLCLWRRLVWGRRDTGCKLLVTKTDSTEKMQRNAVESHRIILYYKGPIYRI